MHNSKTLTVVLHPQGQYEFRVDGRHVKLLGVVPYADARRAAYEYVWDRPGFLWSIIGEVL